MLLRSFDPIAVMSRDILESAVLEHCSSLWMKKGKLVSCKLFPHCHLFKAKNELDTDFTYPRGRMGLTLKLLNSLLMFKEAPLP